MNGWRWSCDLHGPGIWTIWPHGDVTSGVCLQIFTLLLWPLLSSSERDDGLVLCSEPVPGSSPGAADSSEPSPKHKPSFSSSSEALSPSPLQPRAIVSAVIYVKAFVGPLVLTVSVLSNGNNYGAFHPLFTGLLWGERGLALGEGRLAFLSLGTEPKEL